MTDRLCSGCGKPVEEGYDKYCAECCYEESIFGL